MRTMRNNIRRRSRALALGATLCASAALAGCDDFMKVTNPGAIEPAALEDASYIGLMVNGVIGDFQPTFAFVALFSGVFTDELRNHHSFFENPEFDLRNINDNNGTYVAGVYNGLHRTRFLADSVASRMKVLVGDSASRNLQLARVLSYSGYTWTLMGEQLCETPINRSANVPSEKLLEEALKRYDEAITVAAAAKAAPPAFSSTAARNAYIAGTDSVLNLARVGAARAALNLSAYDAAMKAKALEYARAVTPAYASATAPGYEFRATYARDNNNYSRRTSNPFFEFITSGRWFSISGTPFENLKDPRVPHDSTLLTAADGTRRFIPNSPAAFSTFDGSVVGKSFDAVSTIRVASALEARYVIAELEGLSTANLAFVNQRRAVGGQAPLASTTTSAAYMAALREQRARDFFLDGHRLGDLRRYKKAYNLDLFPSGSYFGSSTVQYGTQECWPIPLSEKF